MNSWVTRADLHYLKKLKYIYDLYFKAFVCSKEAIEMIKVRGEARVKVWGSGGCREESLRSVQCKPGRRG